MLSPVEGPGGCLPTSPWPMFSASFCSARCWDQIFLAPCRDAATSSACAAALRLENRLDNEVVTRLSLPVLVSSKIGLEAVRRNTGPGSGSTPWNTSGRAMAGSKGSMAVMGNSSAHGTNGTCPFFRTAPFQASFHGERAILQKALLTVWVYSLLRNNFLRDEPR